jgi:ubiquinone/menaquinone biosynthesis C-methylase UbiE
VAEYKNFNTYTSEDHHANVKESFKNLRELISIPSNKKSKVLDVGCATGALIGYLKSHHPDWQYTGIDISDDLLDIARQKISGVDWIQGSATNMPGKFKGQYSLITCFGVLGIFDEDDAIKLFDELLRCVEPGGEIILFSQFNEMDADTQITHRKYDKHGKDNGWEKGWNNYSMRTVKKWLKDRVSRVEFIDFSMPIDLDPKDDLVRSWTIKIDQQRRLTNGLKLLIDLKFLKITVKGNDR